MSQCQWDSPESSLRRCRLEASVEALRVSLNHLLRRFGEVFNEAT